jgi:hypothetical protein
MSQSQKSQNQSPLEQHQTFIEDLVLQGLGNSDIVFALKSRGVRSSEGSIRRAKKRWGIETPSGVETPGVKRKGDAAEVVTRPYHRDEVHSIEDMLKERQLDPEEWEVIDVTLNEWEGAPVKGDQKKSELRNRLYRQLKIRLRRKAASVLPSAAARLPGFVPPKSTRKGGDEGLVVFTGDQQAPNHDQDLHEKFCSWLSENRPAKGVLIGDTVDFPDISRHRYNPENTATVQQCINSGYQIVHDYVSASPDTQWTKLCGNHDERIRNTLIDWTVELYGIKRAEIEGQDEESVLSVSHLLRLDELGVEYLDPAGSYQHAQVNVTPYLAARHGWIAQKGSGASALKTLEHLGYSIVVGHTHRQSLVHKTTHSLHGDPKTLAAVETGCMCNLDGLGYAVAPDWQQGFATAQVWKNGMFKLDLATYVSDTLLWRDQCYG